MRLRLDPSVRRAGQNGRTLLGGSPYRIVSLSPDHVRALDEMVDRDGGPIAEAPQRSAFVSWLIDAGMANPCAVEAMLDESQIDLVIPCRDHDEAVARLVTSIGGSAGFCSITVVDDGSTVPVSGLPPQVSVQRVASAGAAAARNLGGARGDAPLILFLDADVELIDASIDACVAGLLAVLEADPRLVACAPRVRASGSTVSSIAEYERHRPSLDMGTVESAVAPNTRVPYVPSAALLVRREAFEAIGGFDPDCEVGEDVDLVWRLIADGGRVRYVPDVVLAHPARVDMSAWLRQRMAYGESNAELAARHPEGISATSMSPWSAAALGLFASGGWRRSSLGAVVVVVSAVGLARELRSRVPDPWHLGTRLVVGGTAHAALGLAEAIRRSWWPVLAPAALRSVTVRRLLFVAFVVPATREWIAERPRPFGLTAWIAFRGLDDGCFAVGLVRGVVRTRSLRALRVRWQQLSDVVSPAGSVPDRSTFEAAGRSGGNTPDGHERRTNVKPRSAT